MSVSPPETIDFDYASSVARQAFQHMAHHKIPPTPDNFSVWSRYVSGTAPALKKAIDIIIASKRQFDAATSHDLHQMYVSGSAEGSVGALMVSDQLSALMSAARGFLSSTIDDNRAQVRVLGTMSADAQAGSDAKLLVEKLVSELAAATARASTMEANFSEASREIDTIRVSLQKAEEQSRTDTLTGLANRRAMDEFFRQAQIDAMEKGTPVSMMMIDIDHFKRFNDSFGHQVGDQVLRLVANVLREQVRDHDLAARFGGEELVAILPGASLQVCVGVAERIRLAISQRRIRRRTTGEEISAITVSVGVAQFQPGESQEGVTERCDAALYLAKRRGRNLTMSEIDLAKDGVAA